MEKYLIIGTNKRKSEVIDEAETAKDAEYLAREYGLSFGKEWHICVKWMEDEPI